MQGFIGRLILFANDCNWGRTKCPYCSERPHSAHDIQHFDLYRARDDRCIALAHLSAQDLLDAPPPDIAPPSAAPKFAADAANLEGCQVIARVDDQIVLACDVLWRVNQMLEDYQQKASAEQQVPAERLEGVRQQLMKREVASMVDRKLLYNEFRRNVPAENLPRIEQNLREPFEQHELPQLMKELKVDNQRDLEIELARLGSSLADVRRAFNERLIASEWIRSKIKVSEDVGPDEMIEYYRATCPTTITRARLAGKN